MLKKADYKKFNESGKQKADYRILIKDIIRLINYYDKKVNNIDNPLYCFNQFRHFQYSKHLEILQNDLKLELSFFKWYFKNRG